MPITNLVTSAPEMDPAFDWFTYEAPTPFKLAKANGDILTLKKGSLYGVTHKGVKEGLAKVKEPGGHPVKEFVMKDSQVTQLIQDSTMIKKATAARIRKFKSSVSIAASVPKPERDTMGVGSRIQRIFKTSGLPAKFPIPAKSTAVPGRTVFTFSLDRKLSTKHLVNAIVEGLPEWVQTEVTDGNQVTIQTLAPLGVTYTETLVILANDDDAESKMFTVTLID